MSKNNLGKLTKISQKKFKETLVDYKKSEFYNIIPEIVKSRGNPQFYQHSHTGEKESSLIAYLPIEVEHIGRRNLKRLNEMPLDDAEQYMINGELIKSPFDFYFTIKKQPVAFGGMYDFTRYDLELGSEHFKKMDESPFLFQLSEIEANLRYYLSDVKEKLKIDPLKSIEILKKRGTKEWIQFKAESELKGDFSLRLFDGHNYRMRLDEGLIPCDGIEKILENLANGVRGVRKKI